MDFLANKKNQLFVGGIVFICLLLVGIFFIWQKQNEEKSWENLTNTTSMTSSEAKTSQSQSQSQTITVDIKGEVVKPGVYVLSNDARMQKLVQLAGGFTKEAQQKEINLAQKLQDQQMVYVPNKKEQLQTNEVNDTEGSNMASATSNEKVNINTADLTQLQTLSGIGIKKAEAILTYREENGNFKSIEELKEVSGIGEKTVEKLRASITI